MKNSIAKACFLVLLTPVLEGFASDFPRKTKYLFSFWEPGTEVTLSEDIELHPLNRLPGPIFLRAETPFEVAYNSSFDSRFKRPTGSISFYYSSRKNPQIIFRELGPDCVGRPLASRILYDHVWQAYKNRPKREYRIELIAAGCIVVLTKYQISNERLAYQGLWPEDMRTLFQK